jgi:serralysin
MCSICGLQPYLLQYDAPTSDPGQDFGADGGRNGASRTVVASGNQLIDGVLTSLAWTYQNIFFSFPTSALQYQQQYGSNEPQSFQPLNAAMQNAARYSFNLLSQYVARGFQELNVVNAADAEIRIALSTSPGTALGYYPGDSNSAGDIWFNPNGGPTYTTPALGNWGQATMMHEIGHAMGLKHGHEASGGGTLPKFGPLPTAQDNWNYSIMTYRSYTGAAPDPVQGNFTNQQPTSYMQADILALQYLYGPNFNHNSGNTVYSWDPSGQLFVNGFTNNPGGHGPTQGGFVFETIWDGNGIDTYNTSNFANNQVIDLRPGAFSTFAPLQVVDLDNGAAVQRALGNIANSVLFNNDARSLIENATTGNGHDVLIGNDAANVLTGGGGNDVFIGGRGDDTFNGGLGVDTASYEGAQTGMTVDLGVGKTFAGPEIGTDTLSSIENVIGGDSNDVIGGGNAIIVNRFEGRAGDDQLFGGEGDDVLDGGMGMDLVSGGGGNDLLIGGANNDTFDGGPGSDTLDYRNMPTGMTLVMGSLGPNSGQVFAGEPIGNDQFSNIEHVLCPEGSDTVGCDGNGNYVAGFGGHDTIFGWTGQDLLQGGNDNDQLFGQQDNDTLEGQNGDDWLYGWAGNDSLHGGAGADHFMWTGAGEGTDKILDYSYGAGDLIHVAGNPSQFTFGQFGTDVLIFDPQGFPIFQLINYSVSNGLAIVPT